jgi:hypothetical protein
MSSKSSRVSLVSLEAAAVPAALKHDYAFRPMTVLIMINAVRPGCSDHDAMNGERKPRRTDTPVPPPSPPLAESGPAPRPVKGWAQMWLQALLERLSIYPVKD